MNPNEVAQTLHPLERKVLPHLQTLSSVSALAEQTGLQEIEVMRAIQWLQNKSLAVVKETLLEVVRLESNGRQYQQSGLPERNFLKQLHTEFMPVARIAKAAGVDEDEINICIGALKKKAAIELSKNGVLMARLTKTGSTLKNTPSLEEKFIQKLNTQLPTSELSPEDVFALEHLKTRKQIIKIDIIKKRHVSITNLGKAVLESGIESTAVDRVTPAQLKDGSWKDTTYRRYDVEINVPHITGGRRHFVNQATDTARQVWLSMGFQEMTGTLVQTSLWNFDALFTAQDHPVRDMQDTFFIQTPASGNLPSPEIVSRIQHSHEQGCDKSTGWGYRWKEQNAKQNVLRTHTTCLSARTLAQLQESDMPAKFFALGKCFRNETMDWSHLFELNQTEGIVIDPNANFRHLLGYLKQFFSKMGFPKARFRPAYFPYTEPSVEIDVFHEARGQWLELGGAGIFRPEVTVPLLGKDIPVLAWGPGFDRIIMDFFGITDIRELYQNDIKQLREIRTWMG